MSSSPVTCVRTSRAHRGKSPRSSDPCSCTKTKKCRPSGRNCGQRWLRSPAAIAKRDVVDRTATTSLDAFQGSAAFVARTGCGRRNSRCRRGHWAPAPALVPVRRAVRYASVLHWRKTPGCSHPATRTATWLPSVPAQRRRIDSIERSNPDLRDAARTGRDECELAPVRRYRQLRRVDGTLRVPVNAPPGGGRTETATGKLTDSSRRGRVRNATATTAGMSSACDQEHGSTGPAIVGGRGFGNGTGPARRPLQRCGDVTERLPAVLGVPAQATPDNPLHIHRRRTRWEGRRVGREDGRNHGGLIRRLEGATPRRHFVEDRAEPEDIAAYVGRMSFEPFRREIGTACPPPFHGPLDQER